MKKALHTQGLSGSLEQAHLAWVRTPVLAHALNPTKTNTGVRANVHGPTTSSMSHGVSSRKFQRENVLLDHASYRKLDTSAKTRQHSKKYGIAASSLISLVLCWLSFRNGCVVVIGLETPRS